MPFSLRKLHDALQRFFGSAEVMSEFSEVFGLYVERLYEVYPDNPDVVKAFVDKVRVPVLTNMAIQIQELNPQVSKETITLEALEQYLQTLNPEYYEQTARVLLSWLKSLPLEKTFYSQELGLLKQPLDPLQSRVEFLKLSLIVLACVRRYSSHPPLLNQKELIDKLRRFYDVKAPYQQINSALGLWRELNVLKETEGDDGHSDEWTVRRHNMVDDFLTYSKEIVNQYPETGLSVHEFLKWYLATYYGN